MSRAPSAPAARGPLLLVLLCGYASRVAGQFIKPAFADVHGGNLLHIFLPKNVTEEYADQLQCHFGSHAVPAVLFPERTSVGCMVPPASDGRPGKVGVSVTAHNFPLSEEMWLAYYNIMSGPTLSSVSPRSAQASQPVPLRVRGENFAPLEPGKMKCRFRGEGLTNATFVAHDEIMCDSPLVLNEELSRTVPLQISLDGEIFSEMGEVEFTVESHLPSNITSISPSHGPTDGGTEIEVHGVGFNPFVEGGRELDISCHFHNGRDWNRETPATFLSSHLVKCSTPAYSERDEDGWHGDVTLSVGPAGEEGHEESNKVHFGYYVLGGRPLPLKATPRSGDFEHPPAIALEGQGFSPTGDDLECVFGDVTNTAASFISAHEVHCAAPHELPLGAIDITATTDGGYHVGPDPITHPRFTPPQLIVYDASKPPVISSVSPAWAPISGGAQVIVRGSNLAPTPKLACVFERSGVSPATFINETAVSCATPLNARIGSTLLSLTLDRATLSEGAIPIDLVDTDSPPRVLLVVPPLSTYHGGTSLVVWGDNFSPHMRMACTFEIFEPNHWAAATPATFLSANKIACDTPYSGEFRGTAEVRVWADEVSRNADVVREALHELERRRATADSGSLSGVSDLRPVLSTTVGRMTFYNPDLPPQIHSVTPDFAPASNDYGGHHITVRGSNFAPVGNVLVCEFGAVATVHASFINGSAMGCHIASNLVAGDIQIRVSMDGGLTFSPQSVRFTYYEPQHPPLVFDVSPREIDLADPPPHLVEITGQNFAPTSNLSCGFGAAREVESPALFESFTRVRCSVPPLAWEHNLVDTTHDGVRWSGQSMMWDPDPDYLGNTDIKKVPHPGHIIIYNSSKTGLLESVFPTALKIGTKQILTVRGYNLFAKARTGRCYFTPHDRSFGIATPDPTPATAIDAEHVQCEAPHATEPQTLSMSLELDGHAGGFEAAPGPLGDGHLTLSFFDPSYPPMIDDSDPHFGERHHPSVVRLYGHNFGPAYAYKDSSRIHHAGILMCRFGKLHSFTHATFVHSHAVLCETPYTEHLGHVELGFSYDHAHTWVPTPKHVNYTFIDSDFPPEVKSVSPNVDSCRGGALLEVKGDNFYPDVDDDPAHVARQYLEHGHEVLAGSLGAYVRGSNTQPMWGRRLFELASAALTFADAPTVLTAVPEDAARPLPLPRLADPSGAWGAIVPADDDRSDFDTDGASAPNALVMPNHRRSLRMVPQQFCLLSKPNGWPLAMSPATFIDDETVRCISPHVDECVADVNFHLISKTGVRSYPKQFTLFDPNEIPTVEAMFPQGVPYGTSKSTVVQVRGTGFADIGPPFCKFGDATPTPATVIRSTLALCATPSDIGGQPRSIPLSITRDGLPSVSGPDVLFSFYDPTSRPATAKAVPPYADRHGGHNVTVYGSGFQPLGADLVCLIGQVLEVPATFISTEQVKCMLPPAEAEWEGEDAWASVCVTHAGAAHDQDNCNAHVEFYDPHKPPQLAKLEPRLLPLTSDYTHPIHIFGANMAPTGDKLLCRFDESVPVPATFVKGDEVQCQAPDVDEARAISVTVSIDGGSQFSEPLPFVRFDMSRPPTLDSVKPLYAPRHTPTEITLKGENFAPTPDFMCRFAHLEPTPATFISTREARCFTPNVEETYTIPLKAELMREGPWSNQLPFTLYDADRPPHVKNFSKHWGSIDGGEITDLYGDDFAPTEFLRTRFGNEGSSIVNYGPATFVTVYHIRVEIPRYHEPATVEVYATNDGKEYGSGRDWYDHKPVMYTYYDPRHPPSVSSMEPKYGHHAVGTVVTIKGWNFAPIPERLNVRWGSLGEDQGTFVSSDTILAMSILPSPEVLSMSVPIQVAPTSLLSPPEAEWVTDDLFTYWQPYLPPGLSAATPLEGACFNGGQKLADTRTSELMEVSARDYVDVEGFNFVPSPHLSCVYHHVGGSGFSGVDDYQVFLPGIFVKSDAIRCPIPTIKYADDGTSMARAMWLTVTNDGITYRYSHTKFTFIGDCLPTKFTTVMFGLIAGLAVLLLGACLFGGKRSVSRGFVQLNDNPDNDFGRRSAPAPSSTSSLGASAMNFGSSAVEALKKGASQATQRAKLTKEPVGRQPQKAEAGRERQPQPAPDIVSRNISVSSAAMASENAQERPTRPAPAPALPSRPSGGVVDPEARLKQRGTLTVLVKEAKNLKGRDADGLSNPYVAIKVKNHKTWKSQVHKRTLNPKFDEKFEAKGVLGDFVNNLMLLKVIDRNTDNIVDQTKGDSLGDLSFKLDGLRTRNRVPYENVDLDMVDTGSISVILTWEADPDTQLTI